MSGSPEGSNLYSEVNPLGSLPVYVTPACVLCPLLPLLQSVILLVKSAPEEVFLFFEKMPTASVTTQYEKPQLDVLVDLGNPVLNRIFDGFVKVGGVGVAHATAQDTLKFLLQEEKNDKSLEKMILKCEFTGPEMAMEAEKCWKKMATRVGKEAGQWGLAAGVYSGMTYGLEETRGVKDWKNALLGGAVAGAALSLTESTDTERILRSAITGGAIAAAGEFIKNIS